jgi:hypothetical protein
LLYKAQKVGSKINITANIASTIPCNAVYTPTTIRGVAVSMSVVILVTLVSVELIEVPVGVEYVELLAEVIELNVEVINVLFTDDDVVALI